MANSIGAIVNSPIDRVKTLIQKQNPKQKQFKGVLDCFLWILRNEGIRGLFRGTVPRIARIGPCGAIQFGFYELSLDIIDKFRK